MTDPPRDSGPDQSQDTVVAHLIPEHLRSNGFGVLGLGQSFGDLGATLVAKMPGR